MVVLRPTNGFGALDLFDILTNGDKFPTNDILRLGQDFVGDNPTTVANGIYRSADTIGKVDGYDVYAQFRITDKDISGHGRGLSNQPHAQFELVRKVGERYPKVGEPIHIFFEDIP
jgi:hypothetical protein